jgi:hypothetical protein
MRLGLSPVVSLAAGALFWTVLACAGRGLLAQKSEAGFHTTCLWITLAYLALILVMPFEAALFSRYFFILLPLLAVWVWRGGSVAAVRPRTSAWMRTSVAVGLCGACLTNAYLTVLSKHGLQQLGAVAQLEDICRRIDDHLPREAKIAVASGLPLCHVHAYTGRSLVDAYPVRKGDATALARHPAGPPEADYLLVDSGTAGESARLRGLQTVLRSSGRDLSAGETGAPA